MAQFYSQVGHVPVHQVSSIWGLKPLSPKYQYICQVLLCSQKAELRLNDSSLFGRHGSTQHKKQSDGYPGESLWQYYDDMDHLESDHSAANGNQPENGPCISNGCVRWNTRS